MGINLGRGLRSVASRNAPDIADEPPGGYATRACRGVDPELFFPIGNGELSQHQYEQARKVCNRCPIWQRCLSDSLERGDEFGMFGGFTHEERKDFKPAKPKRACLVCEEEFEPPRPTQSVCTPCQMRSRAGGTTQLDAFVRHFGDELRQACREGVSDKAFGERYNISHHLVGRARVVLGIPPVPKSANLRRGRSSVGAAV